MQFAHRSKDELLHVEYPCRVLWVGSELPELRTGVDKSQRNYVFEQVEDFADLSERRADIPEYDCIIVNIQEGEHSQYLRFSTILATGSFRKIFVLAPTEKVEILAGLPGVDCVFEKPASAARVVEELDLALSDLEEVPDVSGECGKPNSSATKDELGDSKEPGTLSPAAKGKITAGFETSVSLAQEVDRSIWRRFLPLVNFIYKKLAILVLGSLFLTFLAYGAMIVFYLSSSSWTLPFELSAGNRIVDKVERDLSQLRVSQSQFRQQLTVNATDLAIAVRKERHGRLQIDAIRKTISEEVYSKQREQKVLQEQVDRLKAVAGKFTSAQSESNLADYYQSLKKAFNDKIVSRRALEGVRLSLIDAELQLANVHNEIDDKLEELALSKRQEGQLKNLLSKIDYSQLPEAPTLDSKFSHMVADLMSARTATLTATSEIFASKKREGQLQNSLQLITRNIEHIVQTPAARAIEMPIAVLFVPYQNSGADKPNEDLYGCSFFIFICKKVGKVGNRVDGEAVASHPLFDKPMRGYFIEAKFDDPLSVTEEILHIGRAPVLF